LKNYQIHGTIHFIYTTTKFTPTNIFIPQSLPGAFLNQLSLLITEF